MASVYRRGNVWWISYSYRGRKYRESSRSTRRREAERLLARRLEEIGRGRLVGPSEERLTFENLVTLVRNHYRVRGLVSLADVGRRARHLADHFARYRARDITTAAVEAYVARRIDEGAKPATINRELALLRRGFTLAIEAGLLGARPCVIRPLPENNARQGFVDPGDFARLLACLPLDLRDPIAFLYHSGWRVGEMRTLEWRDVDLAGKVVYLRPELSKNRQARTLPLTGELWDIIERARARRSLVTPLVFHRQGRPLGDFRVDWRKATAAAGLKGLLVHDLRRSAVRNLVRAGVPEHLAMMFTGHKTRSVFHRYNIVTERDLIEAQERLSTYMRAHARTPKVTPIGGLNRAGN